MPDSIRTFSVTSVVGFIVGFAMFGAIVYLPVFFQIVRGDTPTISGLELLPLLAGMVIFSTASGQIISHTGRYRVFPILGTGLMTIGVLLLSRMGIGTSSVAGAAYMLVLGIGLGCVMQVLVLLVQNAVPYSELGVATSGATFFRSIGGSFGTAIFGAIFSNVNGHWILPGGGHQNSPVAAIRIPQWRPSGSPSVVIPVAPPPSLKWLVGAARSHPWSRTSGRGATAGRLWRWREFWA